MGTFDFIKENIDVVRRLYEQDMLNEKERRLFEFINENPNATFTEAVEKLGESFVRRTTDSLLEKIKSLEETPPSETPPEELEKVLSETFKTLALERVGDYRPALKMLAQRFGEQVLRNEIIATAALFVVFASSNIDINEAQKLVEKYKSTEGFTKWVVERLGALATAKTKANEIMELREEISKLEEKVMDREMLAYELYKAVLYLRHNLKVERAKFEKLLETIKYVLTFMDRDLASRVALFVDMRLKEGVNVSTPEYQEYMRLLKLEDERMKEVEGEIKGKEIPITGGGKSERSE
jgi:hypothetical protein